MDLEVPPNKYQNFSPRPSSAYGNNRPNNGRSFDQRPNQSLIETMEIDPEMDPGTIRMETGRPMETFLASHQIPEETSHKIIPTANQEVINLTTLRSADLTINLRLPLRPMNRNFSRTIFRHHLMWFISPQPMIP